MEPIPNILNLNDRIIVLKVDQFDRIVSSIFQREFKSFAALIQPPATKIEYHTRQETADKFHITLPTLDDWSRDGKVKRHKIGRRVLYRSDEIEQALKVQQKHIRK